MFRSILILGTIMGLTVCTPITTQLIAADAQAAVLPGVEGTGKILWTPTTTCQLIEDHLWELANTSGTYCEIQAIVDGPCVAVGFTACACPLEAVVVSSGCITGAATIEGPWRRIRE